ncbi:MAG TPA: rod-binding protein [Syntrophorhabdales bacterium]|nr:rod-binding protein [Syntrophorhabdales bacterium]
MKIPMEGTWLQENAVKGLKERSTRDKKAACEGFEAYLVSTMLNQLQKTTGSSEKSYAEQTYFSMFHEKVAEFVAKKGIGIKDVLMRYLERRESSKVSAGTADNT